MKKKINSNLLSVFMVAITIIFAAWIFGANTHPTNAAPKTTPVPKNYILDKIMSFDNNEKTEIASASLVTYKSTAEIGPAEKPLMTLLSALWYKIQSLLQK